ncbi:hypothetical protein J2X20_001107 [Pelomonas saccharophila]|jgi:hypothetical protein|uniref:DUF2789 domain-containing protein n=1 Tax=Roseateles saccharophilus TaxID=304 RepID=A0ABU1YI22_ROSSA|nr:DUF2789 domain-containing protein [Roseateles saccharophilus]MDR7268478.1 hypothetical protein [Roseateles saccharophilus]
MDSPFHSFSDLFSQLGLPADDAGIAAFLSAHAPLGAGVPLAEASFWTPAQATLLREELLEDADWAEVVDRLSAALQQAPG